MQKTKNETKKISNLLLKYGNGEKENYVETKKSQEKSINSRKR